MSSKLFVVVGGQYGSEGKGAVAGRICADVGSDGRPVANVRVGGPNAGHTVMGKCPPSCDGAHPEARLRSSTPHPWRLRQVPVAAVTNVSAHLVIAAGSEVNPEVLENEVRDLHSAGYSVHDRLVIDRSATVLERDHVYEESDRQLSKQIGSTAKGIGAARASRIWREATTWGQSSYVSDYQTADTAELLRGLLATTSTAVVIEGTQGYGLGLHTDNYPYTTSGDCRAVDFLGQVGISPWMADSNGWSLNPQVVVCLRPYPIRVAGNSGDLNEETTWSELGLPVEYTTVTQKVRRVGHWDSVLAGDAIAANGGPRAGVVWVAMTMMDSVDPALAGKNGSQRGWDSHDYPRAVDPYMKSMGMSRLHPTAHLGYVGTGPDTALVNERMYD